MALALSVAATRRVTLLAVPAVAEWAPAGFIHSVPVEGTKSWVFNPADLISLPVR